MTIKQVLLRSVTSTEIDKNDKNYPLLNTKTETYKLYSDYITNDKIEEVAAYISNRLQKSNKKNYELTDAGKSLLHTFIKLILVKIKNSYLEVVHKESYHEDKSVFNSIRLVNASTDNLVSQSYFTYGSGKVDTDLNNIFGSKAMSNLPHGIYDLSLINYSVNLLVSELDAEFYSESNQEIYNYIITKDFTISSLVSNNILGTFYELEVRAFNNILTGDQLFEKYIAFLDPKFIIDDEVGLNISNTNRSNKRLGDTTFSKDVAFDRSRYIEHTRYSDSMSEYDGYIKKHFIYAKLLDKEVIKLMVNSTCNPFNDITSNSSYDLRQSFSNNVYKQLMNLKLNSKYKFEFFSRYTSLLALVLYYTSYVTKSQYSHRSGLVTNDGLLKTLELIDPSNSDEVNCRIIINEVFSNRDSNMYSTFRRDNLLEYLNYSGTNDHLSVSEYSTALLPYPKSHHLIYNALNSNSRKKTLYELTTESEELPKDLVLWMNLTDPLPNYFVKWLRSFNFKKGNNFSTIYLACRLLDGGNLTPEMLPKNNIEGDFFVLINKLFCQKYGSLSNAYLQFIPYINETIDESISNIDMTLYKSGWRHKKQVRKFKSHQNRYYIARNMISGLSDYLKFINRMIGSINEKMYPSSYAITGKYFMKDIQLMDLIDGKVQFITFTKLMEYLKLNHNYHKYNTEITNFLKQLVLDRMVSPANPKNTDEGTNIFSIIDFSQFKKEVCNIIGEKSISIIKDKYTIRLLNSSEELSNEGNDMNHCVGGRSYRMRTGDAFIVSITRNSDGYRSTCQIDYDGTTFKEYEHRGVRNEKPNYDSSDKLIPSIIEIFNKADKDKLTSTIEYYATIYNTSKAKLANTAEDFILMSRNFRNVFPKEVIKSFEFAAKVMAESNTSEMITQEYLDINQELVAA